jgi:hypothetical protein
VDLASIDQTHRGDTQKVGICNGIQYRVRRYVSIPYIISVIVLYTRLSSNTDLIADIYLKIEILYGPLYFL